jgi:2-polyprenyl-6-methoxyphenol hydroxylase-like FAD-dependent oxidoreductase
VGLPTPGAYIRVMAAATDLRVAIIGAGIGGLALGLALREHGVAAEVFEQAPVLAELGAAVGVGGNATRLLRRMGLLEELEAVATVPTELVYRRWRTGERIAAHPVRDGDTYRKRVGAPWLGIHRAEYQRVLGTAYGSAGLHLEHRLVDLVQEPDAVTLTFANGRTAQADVVVGADGVRSVVRQSVSDGDDIVYSGTSGFRGIVARADVPTLPDPEALQFWMGPDAHLLHYAIGSDAEEINLLAVVEGPRSWDAADRWLTEVEPDDVLAQFSGWHPAATEMVAAAAPAVRWGLFVVQPLLHWYRGRVVLLGDAAHAMLPHHGQGANTTVEDAFTLAALLAEARPDDLDPVLASYQRLRRARTRQIAGSSWATNTLLHLRDDDPDLPWRDEKMRRFADDFGWIHEFDTEQALTAR